MQAVKHTDMLVRPTAHADEMAAIS